MYADTVKASLLMALPDLKSKNRLWITTQGSGIVSLDVATGKTKHFTTATGLPDSTVYAMMADKQGFFWCSSNRGIFRFNPKDGTTISFTVKDGLPGNEFNRYHFMQMPDGRFAFGGTAGYTLFHPDSMYIDYFQPPTFISDIQVNNQPLGAINAQLKDSAISSLQHIQLAYNQNFLTIRFAGLQYDNPEKIQYRYKMEGLDKNWTLSGTEAIARYTALAPGHYTFVVNTANTSGIWSNKIKRFEIIILQPWWKRNWAYLLYFTMACMVIYALYRNWMQRAKAAQQIMMKQKETEQLKAVDEIKSRFFSNITHEFRTPLSLIIAPAQQLQKEKLLPQQHHLAATIQRNARQLLQLINQLLDMAKLEAATMKIMLFRGSINAFVQDQLQSFTIAAATKNIAIQFTGNAGSEEYLFDADKLHTILSNLVSNAIKFTPAGGSISVTVHQQHVDDTSATLKFTVQDSGIGISADKLPFIFNRFYQVDDSRTRNYEGAGIGLALAKELAELMQGTLIVGSEPAKGTCFTLILTLLKAPDTSAPAYVAATEEIVPIQTETIVPTELVTQSLILIVEDNKELNEFIAQTFRRQYRVITAANGAEGLRMAHEELPDVIISDLMMPQMDGYEFCKAIKTDAATNYIAFLLLTAKAAPISKIEGLQSGADDYLTKPFVAEELQLRVCNMLKRQQQLRAYFRKQLTVKPIFETTLPTEATPDIHPFLKELYAIIEKHLDDSELSVEKLATKAAVSKRTLNRKLDVIIGLSPSEIIKQYRLKKALDFLQQGMGVAEVTYRVGYESPAHFSTLFKMVYGKAPSEYVKEKV